MKKIAGIAVVGALFLRAFGAFALDTSVSNEYWCTWGYVNAATSSVAGVSSSLMIDTKSLDIAASEAPQAFDTHACGALIIVR